MTALRAIPLFAVVWLIYNALVMGGGAEVLDGTIVSVGLLSGATWTMTIGDGLTILGLVALYVEIFKATRTGTASVLDHTFSAFVLIAFVVEFVTFAGAGTSVFFVLGMMSLIDVIAGFTVTIVAARRDLGFDRVS